MVDKAYLRPLTNEQIQAIVNGLEKQGQIGLATHVMLWIKNANALISECVEPEEGEEK